jgi:hypothetical protein
MRLTAISIAALLLCGASPAFADTTFGIQGLVLSGSHATSVDAYSGTGEGALLELQQRWPGVQLRFEGIPNVATATVDTKDEGPIRATIGVFSGSALVRLDPHARFWIGAGDEVLSQETPQTPVPEVALVDASRLCGTRFDFATHLPAGDRRFIETDVAVIPSLHGTVQQWATFDDGFSVHGHGDENATMTDVSAELGFRRGAMEYLYGVRSINFDANFTNGHEADRNTGIGVTAELRVTL